MPLARKYHRPRSSALHYRFPACRTGHRTGRRKDATCAGAPCSPVTGLQAARLNSRPLRDLSKGHAPPRHHRQRGSAVRTRETPRQHEAEICGFPARWLAVARSLQRKSGLPLRIGGVGTLFTRIRTISCFQKPAVEPLVDGNAAVQQELGNHGVRRQIASLADFSCFTIVSWRSVCRVTAFSSSDEIGGMHTPSRSIAYHSRRNRVETAIPLTSLAGSLLGD